MSEASAALRVTNATKATAGGMWLALVTLAHGRHDGTVLHVARIGHDGRVWLPAAVSAQHRAAVAPAVAEAARVMLAEGRS